MSDSTARTAIEELLHNAAGLVDLLGLFGLTRADDGSWVAPATVREFARASLASRPAHLWHPSYASTYPF